MGKDFAESAIRKALGMIGTVALTLTAGCGMIRDSRGVAANDDAYDSVRLTFSGWVPHMEDAVALWNSRNPDVQVDFKRIASDAADNYFSRIEAGVASDVLQVSGDTLVDLVIDHKVQDISQYVADSANLFISSDWNAATFGKGIYGVPQDSSPSALMYRKDILTRYGIDVPRTWDEYLNAARKLHAADADAYITAFTPNETSMFVMDFYQEGGTFHTIEDGAWKVMLNSRAARTVADRWQTLIDEHLVKVVDMWTPDFWSAVNDGSIVSFNYQAWFPVLLEENAPNLVGKWSVAPSPSDSGHGPASDVGGSFDTIPVTCRHPKEASTFVLWLNSSEEALDILIGQGGLFPAAKSGLKNDALYRSSAYWNGLAPASEFVKAANDAVRGTVGPRVDMGLAALQEGFARVATGHETLREVVAQADLTLRQAAADEGLEVR